MSSESAEVQPPAADARPTCRCGYHRDHPMVSALKTYSWAGKFWVYFFGVSYDPLHIDFRCRVCEQIFDHSDDPSEFDKYY